MDPLANKEVVFDLDAAAFSSDDFRMFQFKVKRCPRARPHDWTQCPFAHPGEKAKRRDPRKYRYSGTACPEFRRNGCCRRGDACPFAHGVFECWLHPSRYRTQMCTDGSNCKRRVCFFAHTESELRKPEEDPLWLQQQLQAELAAEQQVQQQIQALKVFANILGPNTSTVGGQQAAAGQQPGLDMLKNLPSSTLTHILGAVGQGAPGAHLAGGQQGGSGDGLLQLLQLVEQQQQQQQQSSAAAAAAAVQPPQLAPAASAPANLANLLSAVTAAVPTGTGGATTGAGQEMQLKLAQQLLQQTQQQHPGGTHGPEALQARLSAQLAGLSLQQQQAKASDAEAKQHQQQATSQANLAMELLNIIATQQHQQAAQQQQLAVAAAAALASASQQQQAQQQQQTQASGPAANPSAPTLVALQQLASLGVDLQALGITPEALASQIGTSGTQVSAASTGLGPDSMSMLVAALQGSFAAPGAVKKDNAAPSQTATSQSSGGAVSPGAAPLPQSSVEPLMALLAAAAGQSAGSVSGVTPGMLTGLQGMLGQLSLGGSGVAPAPGQPQLAGPPSVPPVAPQQQQLLQNASSPPTPSANVAPPVVERSSTSESGGTPPPATSLASAPSTALSAAQGSEGSTTSAPCSPPHAPPVIGAPAGSALSALAAAAAAGTGVDGNAALATLLAEVYSKPEMLMTAQSLIERMANAATAGAGAGGGPAGSGVMDTSAVAALAGLAATAAPPPPMQQSSAANPLGGSGNEEAGNAARS
ncbi:hypothetical protein Vafri_16971 [Volvox africanus]|uniref:C3H1-type domain-containing protein n=1 Tax=Volvox africanus TaxID=51714 RepID=A0A8J4BIG2_9CHLO|nr:hypothetical protein Vafri_16971 [Volvox africanus]